MISRSGLLSSASTALLALYCCCIVATRLGAEPLGDDPTSDAGFCSSWLDFSPSIDFKKDQEISITLDRSGPNPTKRIYVRLVPENGSFNSDKIGISTVTINDAVVKIKLAKDYLHIKQLSIHGGINPFGGHPMPSNAGTDCPIMLSAERK
jgi:hypothetical protein